MRKICTFLFSIILVINIFAIPVSAQEESSIEVYRMVESEPSEYGYINYKFVDENGNEVDFGNKVNRKLSKSARNTMLLYSPSLPSSYDLRDYGYVTAVKNQGSTGNCWAFGCMSSLESNSVKQGNSELSETDFSEAHLVWFSKNSKTTNTEDLTYGDGLTVENPYTYGTNGTNSVNSGGNWNYVVEALSKWSGLAKEKDYPFYPWNHSNMGNYDESKRYDKGSGVVLKSAEELADATAVKQWIMENGAVAATYYSDKQLYDKTTYAYNYTTEKLSNHLISIVGWDDDYSVDNFLPEYAPQNSGAWLCKNSWNTTWGLDGYFWISYEDLTLCDFVGFTTQKSDDFTNNYTYNGRGYMTPMTAGYEPRYSNVFKAKNYEAITDVATYILQPDTDVTISIYKDLPENYTSPVEGNLVTTHKVRVERSGYHTIRIPQQVLLKPGTIFSVVILLENETVKPKIAFEDREKYGFTCNEGESFLSNDGGNVWRDMTYYKKTGIRNVCVQALTKCVYEQEPDVYMNFNDNLLIIPTNDFSYLKENVDIFSDSEFLVKDIEQKNISYFATGSTLTVLDDSENTGDFTIVVEGDTNGDGVCDVLDASETELITNGHKNAETLQCYAANGFVKDDIDISAYQNVVNKALEF